ncbi:MAG TPA: hypothetical protein VMF12_00515, partial [Xanthobacteraceae bacterium]|nr:hypothetical protein [Xanthobacteraceae bacterium]
MPAKPEMLSGAAAREQRCGNENNRTQTSRVIAMHAAPACAHRRRPPATFLDGNRGARHRRASARQIGTAMASKAASQLIKSTRFCTMRKVS